MQTLQALTYIEGINQTSGPIWNYAKEPWHPGKGVKPDRFILPNCGVVCTHASYKTTRTWENFNKNDPPFRQAIINS